MNGEMGDFFLQRPRTRRVATMVAHDHSCSREHSRQARSIIAKACMRTSKKCAQHKKWKIAPHVCSRRSSFYCSASYVLPYGLRCGSSATSVRVQKFLAMKVCSDTGPATTTLTSGAGANACGSLLTLWKISSHTPTAVLRSSLQQQQQHLLTGHMLRGYIYRKRV